jgi:hypothetical protein
MKFPFILAVLSVMPTVDEPRQVKPVPEVSLPALEAAPEPEPVPETLMALPILPLPAPPAPILREDVQNSKICIPGKWVWIPDGREGQVTSFDRGICRVLAYGEAYVSLWQDDMLELVYPQPLPRYQFGH